MAEIVIYEAGKTFILKMSEEDMQQLTLVCTAKRKNYYDVVIACFHAGLITLTRHCEYHAGRKENHEKRKNTAKENHEKGKNTTKEK